MNRRRRNQKVAWLSKVGVLAGALLLTGTARAAGAGEDEGSSAMTLILQGVNLLILIGVIVYFAGKPIQRFFQNRHTQVKTDLDSAAGVLSEAETRLAEWESRAQRLDAEVEEIKRVARERAAGESERILSDAEASAERIRRDAEAAVAQEVARARQALREEAADLATKLASDLLEQNVGDDDQRRLVDEFVTRIETSTQGGTH